MPGIKQTMSNKRTYLPRKAKQKVTEAAAAATRVLTGVEEQPGKMCKHCQGGMVYVCM